MNMFRIIDKAITKKLLDFKNIHEYTSHYQASFDKIASFLNDKFSYTCKSIEMFFSATMLMNIGTDYSALILAI